MLAFVKQHLSPLVVSVGLHIGLIVLLSISIAGVATYTQRPAQLTVKATVVDENLIRQALADIEQTEQDQIEQARKQREDEERKASDAREKRQAEERADQERTRLAAQKREREEAQRQQKIRDEQETERKRLAELERQRKIEEQRVARLKAEREAEEQRQREAAEARARARREEQLRTELAAEQRRDAAIKAGKLDEYRSMIVQRINRNWLRPPSATAGLECVVHVRQIPGGEVVDVQIGECNADAAAQRSIEAAVYRSSPLPEPGDPSLFDRNLQITFRPQD